MVGPLEPPVGGTGYLLDGTGTLVSSFFGARFAGIPRELGLNYGGTYGYTVLEGFCPTPPVF